MQFSLRSFKSTIPAKGQVDFAVYGDKVFAVDVPSGCKIKFDNGEPVLFRTGIRFGVNGWFVSMLGTAVNALAIVPTLQRVAARLASVFSGNVFNKISIINDNNSAVSVDFLAGFGDIADDATIIGNTIDVDQVQYLNRAEAVGTVEQVNSIVGVVNTADAGRYQMGDGSYSGALGIQATMSFSFPSVRGFYVVQNTGTNNIRVYPRLGAYSVYILIRPHETYSAWATASETIGVENPNADAAQVSILVYRKMIS